MIPRTIALTIIAFCFAFGLVCGVAVVAHSAESTLAEKIAVVVPTLASKKAEIVDPGEFGAAVNAATNSPQWAAFLVATAAHESGFRAKIARSEYGPHEGDNGKAWGLFQNWKSASNANVWGSPNIAVQVKAASHLSRQFYNMCKNSGVPFPLSTMRALSGRGCTQKLKGEEQRLRTYQRVLARIQ